MNTAEDMPECPEGEHHWCWADHAGTPDSGEVYRLTGISTAAWGQPWGLVGGRICARCGTHEQWEAKNGHEPSYRWSAPDPDLAEKLRELLP